MRHRSTLVMAALLCFAPGPAFSQLQLTWRELGPRVVSNKVALVLPDGTHVEGKALAAEPAGLRLRVSNGERLIPRQSVSLLEVTEYRKIGRIVCALGAAAAVAATVAAASSGISEGPLVVIAPAAAAGGAIGAGIGGYYLGKSLDRKVTRIRIVPEENL